MNNVKILCYIGKASTINMKSNRSKVTDAHNLTICGQQ